MALALHEHFTPDDVATMIRSRALNAKQAETLAAGLRYKRLYEHEQNLLTINRRSRSDIETALDAVSGKYGLNLLVEVDDDASTEAVSVQDSSCLAPSAMKTRWRCWRTSRCRPSSTPTPR
jgi:hypothetical protein